MEEKFVLNSHSLMRQLQHASNELILLLALNCAIWSPALAFMRMIGFALPLECSVLPVFRSVHRLFLALAGEQEASGLTAVSLQVRRPLAQAHYPGSTHAKDWCAVLHGY